MTSQRYSVIIRYEQPTHDTVEYIVDATDEDNAVADALDLIPEDARAVRIEVEAV